MHPLGAELGSFRPSSKGLLPFCVLPAVATAHVAVRRLLEAEDLPLLAVVVVLLLVPGSMLLTWFLLLPLLSLFRVRVHELGVRGHDAYGRRAEAAWPLVQRVEPVDVAGLRYLRVVATGSARVLWLPLFVSERDAFDRLVAERAGAAHPLTLALRSARATRET
jgi:hypothetical protein